MISEWKVEVKRSGGQIRRYGPDVIDVAVTAVKVGSDTINRPFQWRDWSIAKARAMAQAATQHWYIEDEETPHWHVFSEHSCHCDNDSRQVRFVAHRPYDD